MLHPVSELEGIASRIHDAYGRVPVDAFELAEQLELDVRCWPKSSGKRHGDVVWCPAPLKARETRRHGIVAHELGHWLLEQFGLDHRCEESARYLAGALMVPRDALLRDLGEVDLDLRALERRHPNASGEMIVARISQVRPATAWIWDNGKLARRYGLDEADVSAFVDRVLSLEEPVRDGDVGAWPIFDGRWRRVIVVRAEA